MEFSSIRLLLIVLGTMLAFTSCSLAADIYVGPTGSDANPGTRDKPLLTLAGAQKAARAARGNPGADAPAGAGLSTASGVPAGSPASGPLTIHVAAGVYYFTEPLVLSAEDSGTKESPIVWQADDGRPVVISGGEKLRPTWTAYKNGIFQTPVPADLDTDQLFANGERQILARYPNYDPNTLIFNGYAADCISPARVAAWADPAGGFMHAMHPALWGGFSYLVTGKDAKGNLTMEGGWQGNRPAKPHEKYRYVENIFEELDSPGEWFLNRKTHVLYFYPPANVDLSTASIEAARLKNLIEFRGSEQAPVKWVTLRGFTFRHTLRTFMETKEPLLRSDWTIYRGGAVLFNGAEDCALENSFLDQVGGNAVFVNGYNRRDVIRGCRIERSGAGGVMFVGDPAAVRSPLFGYGQSQPVGKIDRAPGPKTDNYPADCRVEDCLITQVGRVEKQSTGVGIDMSARIAISHCSIYDMPRAGINIGDGCWGGNIIEYCDIFDTVKETGDHGSFNSWGRDRYWLSNPAAINKLVAANPDLPLLDAVEPNTLRNSRWRCDHGWDIDLDDGSSNYHIYNNLCLHGGIKNREGFDRVVENNVIVHNSYHLHVWLNNSGDEFLHNIVSDRYRPVGMPARWGKQIDYNLLAGDRAGEAVPATELQKMSRQDEHSLRGDAMFVDPARGDFSVKPGSPALTLGFKNFPMDEFGVTSPALKAIAPTPSFAANPEKPSSRDATVRSWLGADVRNIVGLGEQSAHGLPGETGVLVLDLPASGPLAHCGLKPYDVILAVNGAAIDTVADLLHPPHPATAGTAVKLSVWRDQQSVEIDIPPGQ
jgi:hypothetical protein